MSILDKPSVPEITPAIKIAAQIKQNVRSVYQQLLNTLEQNCKLLWKNPQANPSEIASALGTDASEVIKIFDHLTSALENIKTGSTVESKKIVGKFTVNEDGTITVEANAASSAPK
mgnify:CR=1 FL=1